MVLTGCLLEKIILIVSELLELYQRLQFLIFQKQRRRGSCNRFQLQQQGTLYELSRELKNNIKRYGSPNSELK